MDDRHPKRRKDKYNPYTLSLVDGISAITCWPLTSSNSMR